MVNKGIIRTITDKNILVEPLNSDSPDGHSCGSGSCDHCSHQGKTRLMEIANPEDLPLRIGNLVEFELPTSKAIIAFFKVLLAPPLFFILLYYLSYNLLNLDLTYSIIAGAAGFSLTIGASFLFKGKAAEKEIPSLVKVIR